MGYLKARTGGIIAALIAGWFCFIAGVLITEVKARRPVSSSMGFHFPDGAPDRGISEGNPPYCVTIYKEKGFWRWIVYKHDPDGRTIGGGATESYSLSRDIALTFVGEDKRVCQEPIGSR
jgi:hypothetical protein